MAYRVLEKEVEEEDEGEKSKVEMAVSKGGGVEERENEKVVAVVVGTAEEEEMVKMRQRLVSQVLEIGIIFHSVIIGVTMGMSQNTCTIKPLVAALAFHQIFEGMGLGGCIAQVSSIPIPNSLIASNYIFSLRFVFELDKSHAVTYL